MDPVGGDGALLGVDASRVRGRSNPPPQVQALVAVLEITTELPAFLTTGETLQLQAISRDAAGQVVSGASPSWASSDPSVVTITSAGAATGVAEGASRITATVENVSSSVDLTVVTGSMSYDVVFESTWSAATHPTSFPANAHFSGLIGATHGPGASFWSVGSLASDGIKEMAELGSKSPLDSEVQAAIQAGLAVGLLSGGGVGVSPGSVSLTFDVSADFPLVTLVSMIAPSPDWFVGVSALPLFEEGAWVDRVVVDLLAYDAGTDSGTAYTSPNQPTQPKVDITQITASPFNLATPVGTFTFTRLAGAG